MTDRPATQSASSVRIAIDDRTQIGAARRSAVAIGHAQRLSPEAVGRLAIVVTEAATNVLLHGDGGTILLRGMMTRTGAVEVLALDRGRGMLDVHRSMRDGFSTSGTAGQGLGAMKRLSNVFDIYSQRDAGTVLLARVSDEKSTDDSRADSFLDERIGAISVPLRGQVECGDAWHVIPGRQGIRVVVVDGLGHGSAAAAASAVAMDMFAGIGDSPAIALDGFDAAMRGTRGAALSMAFVDEAARVIRFAGVGNVDARILRSGSSEHLVPQNGIVGHTMPVVRMAEASWPAGSCLVMHSDGISARWRADAYPGLAGRHPSLLAAVIYRDFARDRDDATIVVLCDSGAPGGLPG